jgi:fucose 4-O-acetylase-like acetyltransferase
MMAGRIAWMDAARGIGIVLVVVGHVERGLLGSGIAKGTAWSWLDYAVYSFHMPLFFLIAGLHVPRGLEKGRLPFLRDKLATVAYPYVLWSLIQGAALVGAASVTNGHAEWTDLLLIGWRPISQFWFLYALMAFHLTVLVLGIRPLPIGALAAASLLASYVLGFEDLPENLLHSFPFFVAGILLSSRCLRWGRVRAARLPLLLIPFAVAVMLSAKPAAFSPVSIWALPAGLLGIAGVCAIARSLGGAALAVCAGLGRMSMTVYVLHILAAAGTRIAMQRMGVEPSPVTYFPVCVLAGVLLPVLAHRVLERAGVHYLLGLGRRDSTAQQAGGSDGRAGEHRGAVMNG